MEMRPLTGLELQEALYIWSQSFERGDREMNYWKEWEARTPTGRTTYGVFDAGGLQAAFLLVDEAIHLGPETTVPMSAVCGVGVLPACRGKGYASTGVRYLFERMRENRQPISFLEPFSWDFYGKLGYAWTAPTRRYTVPSRVLKPSPETEYVRAARKEDRPEMIDCYTRLARRYRGMVARRPEVWDLTFDASKKEHTFTYLYERDGEVEGYLCYHGGKREDTRLDEFVTLTPRARHGMLGLLRRHEMQIDKFRWDAPSDDPLWSTFYHSDLETKLTTKHMARIVDVPAALSYLRPGHDVKGVVILAVRDETAPWNHRRWRVEIEYGHVAATPTDAAPQVLLDIQTLARAYLGTPAVAELRAAGHIEVHNEQAFRDLEHLFVGPPTWCCDGF